MAQTLTGARLRAWRIRMDWSQSRLVDALNGDVSIRTLSRWETDAGEIPNPTILRLALERLESLAK